MTSDLHNSCWTEENLVVGPLIVNPCGCVSALLVTFEGISNDYNFC